MPVSVFDQLSRLAVVGSQFANGFKIAEPVGDRAGGATNRPEDVVTVQLLLQFTALQSKEARYDPGTIDGKIGSRSERSKTVQAILAFQRSFMRKPDGVVSPNGQTLERLRERVLSAAKENRSVLVTPNGSDGQPNWVNNGNVTPNTLPSKVPSWIEVAAGEVGVTEIAGKASNSRIQEYHKSATGHAMSDDTAWCASFVNWSLERAGIPAVGSAWSHAWKKWGDPVAQPVVGAVGVIDWGLIKPDKKGKGHVGFVVGQTKKGEIVLLGGNQSNQVRYNAYARDLFCNFRVPKGYQADISKALPVLNVKSGGGGFDATR